MEVRPGLYPEKRIGGSGGSTVKYFLKQFLSTFDLVCMQAIYSRN